VISAARSACGPYYYPADTASSGYNTYVGPDVWNPVPDWQGKLYAIDPGDWHATFNIPTANTSVVAYPSTGQGASGDGRSQAITRYTRITSTFAENMNSNPKTDAEAAYDIWTSTGNETMIQFDFSPLRRGCSADTRDPVIATVPFTEPGSSTVQQWDFCEYGKERIWQLHGANEQSGSLNILDMLMWEVNHGYLPSTDTLSLVGFGIEICSTGGVSEDFQVSRFSLTELPKP
jgi:hypothetical protein